jgi:hypothetical protein
MSSEAIELTRGRMVPAEVPGSNSSTDGKPPGTEKKSMFSEYQSSGLNVLHGYTISSSKPKSGDADSSDEDRFGLREGEGESSPHCVWRSGERTGTEEDDEVEEERDNEDDDEKLERTPNNDANILGPSSGPSSREMGG